MTAYQINKKRRNANFTGTPDVSPAEGSQVKSCGEANIYGEEGRREQDLELNANREGS